MGQSSYQLLNGYQMLSSLSFNSGCNNAGTSSTVNCQLTVGQTINVTKVGSVITITCSSITDRDAFYNSYQSKYNSLAGWSAGTPSPTSSDYYQDILFLNLIPFNINSTCGDGQYGFWIYYIHPSSTISTSGGPGAYVMTINLATITNQHPTSVCNSCFSAAQVVVDQVNGTVNDPNINQTSNVALRNDFPFNGIYKMFSYPPPQSPNTWLGTSFLSIPYYSTRTLPYSGSPLTFIPSLSATTCEFNWMTFNNQIASNGNESQFFDHYFWTYYIVLTDINNPSYYELRNLSPNGTLIYEVNSTYPSGHIVDPNYFV
jgi:hypothetical protein